MTKIKSKDIVVKRVETGSRNQGWNISEPYGPLVSSFTLPTVVQTTNSQSSDEVFKKIKLLVPYRPKNPKPVYPPRIPLLYLPLRPLLSPRGPKQSNRSYALAVQRYKLKLARYDALVSRKYESYLNSLRKYYIRMDKFNLYREKLHGVVREFKVSTVKERDRPWNPYDREILVSLPLRGTYDLTRRVRVGWPPVWINETSHIDGYMENFFRGPPDLSHPKISSMVANALSAAESRALRKLHDSIGEQSVHIGNILAERQQTIDMLGGLIKSLFRVIRSFNVKFLVHETIEFLSFTRNKVAANKILEFFFGVRPLMQDIHAAAELLKKKDEETSIQIKARATQRDSTTIVVPYMFSDSQTTVRENDKLTINVSVKVSYTLRYEVDNKYSSALQQFGLINPAEILWEKLPWSFVIDWALPIGGWIRSFTSETGLNMVKGSKVTTTSVQILIERDFNSTWDYPGDEGTVKGKWNGLNHRIFKKRELLTSTPAYQFPSFKSPISWTHIVEALALFRQKLR